MRTRAMQHAVDALPDSSVFLVEDYVEGAEYSVEGLFRGGKPEILAITEKEKSALPFFVETAHTLPAALTADVEQRVQAEVILALEVLQLNFGIFHVELWLTPDGIVLGEVHGRLGGDYIHRMLAHAIPNLEMFGEVFDDALGRVEAPARRISRGASTRFFTPPPGRLVEVEGWSEVVAHPSVIASELNVSPGSIIKELHSSDDRAGGITVGAESAAEAKRLARELADRVVFHVEPIP